MSKNHCKVEHKWCKFCKKMKNSMFCSYNDTKPLKLIHKCPKRALWETVTLKKLLMQTNFYDIMTSMLKSHPNEKKSVIGYANVYQYLICNKKPVRTNGLLRCVREQYNDQECVDIYGVFNHKGYAISFVDWGEWINMNVERETLDNFTYAEICAAALYEMTYHGFTEEKVNKTKDSFINSIK